VDVTGPLEIIGAAGGALRELRSAGVWFLSMLKRVRRRGEDSGPGDAEQRWEAYRRYQDAYVKVMQGLQMVASIGVPPPLRGALWTWPTVTRSTRRVVEGFDELLAALLEIAVVSDARVIDAAANAAESIADLASSFPARVRPGRLPKEFAEHVDAAAEQLGEFIERARNDLAENS
jgi:hypothetical protein